MTEQPESLVRDNTKRRIPYRWELLLLLWFAFFLQQADRQIYNNLLPLLKVDLQLNDVQVGMVASIFTAVFGLCVLIGGYAADVWRRKWIVLFSLLVWSSATVLTGLSTGLLGLIVFRGLSSGSGEAFYYPAAASLITQAHRKTKATALAIHQSAQYVGIVASFLAGVVGEAYGWRNAFYLFGGFGILLGLVFIVRMQDTPPVSETGAASGNRTGRPPIRQVFRAVLGTPTALMLYAALAGHVFVAIGYLTWMPTLLHEKFGLSVGAAGFSSLAYHYACALCGVLLGGRLSDRWVARRRTIRMEFEWVSLLLASPMIFLMGQASTLFVCCLALGLFGFFRGVYDSNLWTALFDVIAPPYRASATGLMLAWAFLAGAFAPVLMGWAKGVFGLGTAVSALAGVYFASSMIVLTAQRTRFRKDCQEEEALG
ncbi:MAG: MFS transporter [Kiritimatiellia bacterium]|jgi:MFS family permease|nr:MFS transporter [Kiritimatiellia bacterium]